MSRRLCLVFALVLFSCTPATMQIKSACPGGSGSGNPNHPLICIDDSNTNLPVDPYSVTVNDREAQPDNKPSAHPVMIHWWTKSGSNNLGVFFKQKGCVDWLKCNGQGHCWAQVKDVDARKPCEYEVNLNGSISDPVIIVQPCCV